MSDRRSAIRLLLRADIAEENKQLRDFSARWSRLGRFDSRSPDYSLDRWLAASALARRPRTPAITGDASLSASRPAFSRTRARTFSRRYAAGLRIRTLVSTTAGRRFFSGIDSHIYPHKQFLFSAAGLTTQAVIDEAILDIPHSRGGAIERGILAGGIGTTLFYITIGRNGSVSDITFMARTSSLSKTQLSLIFGGFSIHAIHAQSADHYAHEIRTGLLLTNSMRRDRCRERRIAPRWRRRCLTQICRL